MRRRHPLGIAGIVAAALVAGGCGEDPGIEQGTVPFQGTDTEPLNALSDQMKKTTQAKLHTKKSGSEDRPGATPPGTDSGPAPAESKPAAEGK